MGNEKMSPLNVTKKNIWNYRQNKPSLIAEDLYIRYNVPKKQTLLILMARGVYKWLAVRRDLIKVKIKMKGEVRILNELLCLLKYNLKISKKDSRDYQKKKIRLTYLRGYLKAKEEDRAIIKALCHSERWQYPSNDIKAIELLKR